MKNQKHIEWEDKFRLGHTILRVMPIVLAVKHTLGDIAYYEQFENITFTERFIVAPKFFDKGLHKANRLWKYYTFKQLPGAVIFLGSV